MAVMDMLAKRYCNSFYGNCYYGDRSNWHYWGRWVVAGVIIFVALVAVIACSCIARRRRRRGNQPYYGTGWMAPQNGKFGTHQTYPMNGYNNGGVETGGHNPPPAYGQAQQQPQYTGTTFNPNDGYYGQQQGYVQPPQNSYQPNDSYQAPPGPPPNKPGY